ncbi:MAG: hypothetical protein IPI49_30535, partial [Myxococcales bacterium]|nr:hypothetical protein [Myxococcales bacterium]
MAAFGHLDDGAAARHEAQERPVGHQADEPVVTVLHRHVLDALPAHEVGHDLHRIVLLHGEQVGGHVLIDAQ